MKVFISSLISGFEPLRDAARAAVRSLGHEPVMAEDFGARPASPQVACLQGLRSADLVVLILGERYGTIPAGSQMSPTHEEYLDARGNKQILMFVQEGISPEPRQAALLAEAQGWQGGLFREGFTSAEALRDRVTAAIHRFELAHVTSPLNVPTLLATAEALLRANGRADRSGPPMLRFALAAGPSQQVLRPAALEAESLGDALHQQAIFGSQRILERDVGVERRIDGDQLVIEQEDGAGLRLDEHGSLQLRLPLERRGKASRGFGGTMFGIIEETVVAELSRAISFADWTLDRIDPTQRLTHVALGAQIEAANFMGWRTQAEQDASPNAGTMRVFAAPQQAVLLDRPRGAVKFDAKRLAEDLMVPLRRQWKN